MDECIFCKRKQYHIYTSDDSDCKADIYLQRSCSVPWSWHHENVMVFEGNWQRYFPVEITYCPFCGRRLRKYTAPKPTQYHGFRL